MKFTDAAVFPYPNGDTSVRRFALEARALGFDSLVAIDTPSGVHGGVTVLSGVILRNVPARDIANRLKRLPETDTVVSVAAGDAGFNRAVIGFKGVHILRGIHAADKNAFDHVTAKMAADNNVAVDIDLSMLVATRGIARQRALARYRDILVLEARFEFPLTVSTHARSALDLRSTRDIAGLCSLLGMDPVLAGMAMGGVETVTTPPLPPVREVA
jgi:ribonuclease P/MRP protein subunit RPP1